MLSKIRLGVVRLWQVSNTTLVLGIIGLLAMLTWRLGSSPSGLSQSEKLTINSPNLSSILKNPINLPYRLLQDLLLHINHSIFFSRFTAVIIALVIAVGFYYMLKGWLGKSIAMLSAILLVTTPYFILAARSATPAIMYFTPVLILATYYLVSRRTAENWPILLLILAVSLSLYLPGMVWIMILVGAACYSNVKNLAVKTELNRRAYFYVSLMFIVLLLPLIIGLIAHPSLVKPWLLIPGSFGSIGAIAKSWAWAIAAFFFQSRQHQTLSIGKLPLLNAAQVGLIIFGAFVMYSRLRREFLTITGLVLFAALLSGLNDNFSVLALVLPLLTVMMAMGLRYLFIEWRHVFPLNPIAKGFAIGLMSVLVFASVLYGIRYSLIAWPATVAVSHSYVLK